MPLDKVEAVYLQHDEAPPDNADIIKKIGSLFKAKCHNETTF